VKDHIFKIASALKNVTHHIQDAYPTDTGEFDVTVLRDYITA